MDKQPLNQNGVSHNVALPAHSNGVTLNLDELLQYKAQTIRWIPPAKSLWSQLNGQHQSAQKGRGMDFSEVRQYQAGDDIRSIDWRVTARTGKPHTKLFTEEREQPVVLYLDLSQSMIFGSTLLLKSVQLAHFASQICWLTIAQKDRIGAVIDTGEELVEIKPSSRRDAPLRILQQLLEVNNRSVSKLANGYSYTNTNTNTNGNSTTQSHSTSLAMGLQSLHRLCPKGSEIILISDFLRYHESDYSLFTQICRHNRVKMVHIFDPLEQGDTRFRGAKPITDGRQTQWFNFSSKKERSKLQHAFDTKQAQLQSLCLSLSIAYQALSCATPLLTQLTGEES